MGEIDKLNNMTVAALKKLAAKHGIELKGKLKAEIAMELQKALKLKEKSPKRIPSAKAAAKKTASAKKPTTAKKAAAATKAATVKKTPAKKAAATTKATTVTKTPARKAAATTKAATVKKTPARKAAATTKATTVTKTPARKAAAAIKSSAEETARTITTEATKAVVQKARSAKDAASGLLSLTVAKLKEYALKHGIDIKSKIKTEIIDEIQKALSLTPTEPAAPVAKAKPAAPVAETKPAAPVAEAKPAAPVAKAKPAAPVAKAKPAAPVAEAKPAAPVAEAKPAAPVAETKPAPETPDVAQAASVPSARPVGTVPPKTPPTPAETATADKQDKTKRWTWVPKSPMESTSDWASAIPVEPGRIFISWDIKTESSMSRRRLVLRILDITDNDPANAEAPYIQVPLKSLSGGMFISVLPGHNYEAFIGTMGMAGDFIALIMTAIINTPEGRPAEGESLLGEEHFQFTPGSSADGATATSY